MKIDAGAGGGKCGRCKKVYGLMGLAAKKGAIVSGGEACANALRNGVGGLLILAGDSSDNAKDGIMRAARGKDVYTIVFGARRELGRRIGKRERSAMIITDRGLTREICALLGFAERKNGGAEFGKNQSL